MNAEIMYTFLDRFSNSIKLEYCFGICKMLILELKKSSPEEINSLYESWEKSIRERFELNLSELEKTESITEKERNILYSFMESLIKEINTK